MATVANNWQLVQKLDRSSTVPNVKDPVRRKEAIEVCARDDRRCSGNPAKNTGILHVRWYTQLREGGNLLISHAGPYAGAYTGRYDPRTIFPESTEIRAVQKHSAGARPQSVRTHVSSLEITVPDRPADMTSSSPPPLERTTRRSACLVTRARVDHVCATAFHTQR